MGSGRSRYEVDRDELAETKPVKRGLQQEEACKVDNFGISYIRQSTRRRITRQKASERLQYG
jgi:hypothetical protein